jgi:hypothetical protein
MGPNKVSLHALAHAEEAGNRSVSHAATGAATPPISAPHWVALADVFCPSVASNHYDKSQPFCLDRCCMGVSRPEAFTEENGWS